MLPSEFGFMEKQMGFMEAKVREKTRGIPYSSSSEETLDFEKYFWADMDHGESGSLIMCFWSVNVTMPRLKGNYIFLVQ